MGEENGARGRSHRLIRRRLCATSAKGRGAPNVCNCLIDEGRPLGTGWQEQVPNHLRRLWSKAMAKDISEREVRFSGLYISAAEIEESQGKVIHQLQSGSFRQRGESDPGGDSTLE